MMYNLKSIKKILFFVIISLLFGSCQFTERFYLNEDGSVRTETELNLSSFMQMMASSMGDSTSQSVEAIDITFDADVKNVDSIVPSNKLKNKTDQDFEAFRKYLDKTKIHIKSDSDLMVVNYITEAKNIKELNKYNKKLHQAKIEILEADTGKIENKKKSSLQQFYYAEYSYKGNKFRRKLFKKNPFTEAPSKNTQDNQLDEMSKMIKYNLEYHFPKPIEKTSLENATFSTDRKTMYYSFTLDKIDQVREQFVDFTVTFKK